MFALVWLWFVLDFSSPAVAALLHDIGDELAPLNHSEYAAAVIKPYVSKKTHWIIQKHGEFQMYYYAHHLGADRNKRDKYKGHKYYDEPYLRFKGTKYEQETFFIKDPNENVLEIKTLTANAD